MESVKDLIVDANAGGVSIALMENHRLIELNQESSQGHNFGRKCRRHDGIFRSGDILSRMERHET